MSRPRDSCSVSDLDAVVTMDHAMPFHCSASDCWTPLTPLSAKPTTQQSELRCMSRPTIHSAQTGSSLLCRRWTRSFGFSVCQRLFDSSDCTVADRPTIRGAHAGNGPQFILLGWAGIRVFTTSHAVPFQCSARVCPPACPTVQQSELLAQSTPPRMLTELGFGVVTIDHALHPNVRPTSGQCTRPFPDPVAQQSTLLTQSTPLRTFKVDVTRIRRLNDGPRSSVSMLSSVVELRPAPTERAAQQSEAVTH